MDKLETFEEFKSGSSESVNEAKITIEENFINDINIYAYEESEEREIDFDEDVYVDFSNVKTLSDTIKLFEGLVKDLKKIEKAAKAYKGDNELVATIEVNG